MSRTLPWAMRAAASLTRARLSAGEVDTWRRIPQRAGLIAHDPGPLGRHDAQNDGNRRDQRGRADVLAEQQSGPGERQQRLDELHLADLRDAPARERGVPGEEGEELADHRDVGKPQ